MRIAVFHNLPSGGAKRSLYEWTRRLAARHTVAIYTLTTAEHAFCDLRPLADRHVEFNFASSRLFRHPWGRINQFQRWRELGRLARLHRTMAEVIDGEGHDVVFAQPCAFTQVPILLQHVRTPSVYFLHEPVRCTPRRDRQREKVTPPTWRTNLDRMDPLIRLYGRRLDGLQRRSIAAARRLLANSAFTRDEMKADYGVDARVSPCGVDAAAFRVLPGVVKSRHVLSVGECSARKGFTFLVESLGAIPAAVRPSLRLACNVVDVDERARVEALAARRNVHVEILQGLATEELVGEYNRAALCVYAPIDEPFGLVALEAMACGTAVVAVREGGVRESVVHQQTGLLLPREPAGFAAAVSSLLSNPALARDYAANARAHVERHWTWERSCDALERHLAEVAGTRAQAQKRPTGRIAAGAGEPARYRAGARSA